MPPKVQLSIPQPCHEDWHKMTPSQQGRFCNACAKQVVDFTTMSDTEVLHYFLDKQGEKVCGRMYPDQLNRPVTKPIYPVKKKLWQWNYAAMFLLFLSKSFSAKAQGAVKVIKTEQAPLANNVELRGTVGMVAYKSSKIISGKITDENGEPIPFVSVQIKGNKIGVMADSKGSYSIKVYTDTDILQVAATGYNTQEVNCKAKSRLDIVLIASDAKKDVVTVGGILSDYDYYPPANPKHVALIEVLDNATHQPVKAKLSINRNQYRNDTATTDSKGIYKLKRITESDKFTVTVNADGYLPSELEIKGWAFSERKESKYVFLEKAPVVSDFKELKSVTVEAYAMGKICRYTVGSVSVVSTSYSRTIQDSLNQFKTKLTGALKIFPNPVAKGGTLAISYSTKQIGNYLLQITNAAGQLLLQQQLTAIQKNNTVQIQAGMEWGSGVYYVRITDTKNNLLSTNSFIVH